MADEVQLREYLKRAIADARDARKRLREVEDKEHDRALEQLQKTKPP